MTLLDKIQADMKEALVLRDSFKVGVLRLIISQVKNAEIEKRSKGEEAILRDEEVEALFRREMKKRKESILLFKKGRREDLSLKEEKELEIITPYLPEGPSEGQIEEAVGEVISRGSKDFGSVMKEVMAKFKGQADGKTVGEFVRKKLGS